MCGIFGYVGKKNAVKVTLNGLKKLEYRGYDSAGIGGVKDGKILYCKEVGKIQFLETKCKEENLSLDVAISQTRWATHGVPSRINAHPHFDMNHTLALVHNGIIENHEPLRQMLKAKNVVFTSDTDTEVVAHLIADFYDGDILKAVQQTLPLLKGTYAFALVHKDFPDQIIATAYEAPLAIGIGHEESFISSDSNAFGKQATEAIYLGNSEVAVIHADSIDIYDATMAQITKKTELLVHNSEEITKGSYQHYTLKEINEQPQTIRNALLSRYIEEYGTAILDGLNADVNDLLSVERILILACGTSWHAGYVAAYMLEDKARIPTQIEISSEFRYKNPIVPHGTFVIAISQSGETADTIAAVRELKAKGAKVMAVCNVHGSTLAREADSCIFLRAGSEIGVCSTKAYTSQLVVLSLFTLMMARMRHMSKAQGQEFLQALKKLPDQVQEVLNRHEEIARIAKKYAHYDNFFFVGRRYMYPTCLEGALKLKEISYINANGYPAGELKHGPIALINENCPTVAFCANRMTFDKICSNLMEIKARKGRIIAIADEETNHLQDIADDIIRVPSTSDELASILSAVASQLFAYYVAMERGAEIDQPRNLAKSVTVE
jgi:glucosamine--fructose-6-phosphate aminotransferase (isomerizing)